MLPPLAFRYIVELILIFSRNQLPGGTALGSLIGETKSLGLSLVKGILGQIDAYWLWFVIILLIGGVSLAGIKRSKAFWVITLVILIMLVIQGVPTMISQYLGQLTGSGFNMYFRDMMSENEFIKVSDLYKIYKMGNQEVRALDGLSLELKKKVHLTS